MFIRMSVENFLSFDKKQELNMIPTEKKKKHSDHVISKSGVKALRSSAIYGANASGKSNLIEAITFSKYAVTRKIPSASYKKFCKTSENGSEKPSVFEFEFVKNDKIYAYGFSLHLSEKKVISEWIYEIDSEKEMQKMLFERETQKSRLEIGEIGLSTEDKNRFETYRMDFEDNSSSLFVTEMNRNKSITSLSQLYFFKEVHDWFANDLQILLPNGTISDMGYIFLYENTSRLNELIEVFDTGISEVLVKEIMKEDFYKALPEEVVKDVLEEIENKLEKLDRIGLSVRFGNSLFFLDANKKSDILIRTVSMKHKYSIMDFEFREESEGTRKLFDLLEILLAENDGKTFIFDEIERSLHPKLTYKFIELFLKKHQSSDVQIIFTTHESTIMDQNLFRRDEIWFVERNRMNVSSVYSLDIFKERYDKKLSKAYLEGRYGAIPVFNEFPFEGDE